MTDFYYHRHNHITLTHSFTHSLTHLLAHSITHSLTHFGLPQRHEDERSQEFRCCNPRGWVIARNRDDKSRLLDGAVMHPQWLVTSFFFLVLVVGCHGFVKRGEHFKQGSEPSDSTPKKLVLLLLLYCVYYIRGSKTGLTCYTPRFRTRVQTHSRAQIL